MRSVTTLMFCTGVLTITIFGIANRNDDLSLDVKPLPAVVSVDPGKACLGEDDVLKTLQTISEAKRAEAELARDVILRESARSQECRRVIIGSIMKFMDKPNVAFEHKPTLFNMWRTGANLLSDLKAVEALDLLIAHLDLGSSGSFSTTMSQQPALRAVINLGPVAIPKLATVLQSSPDRNARMYAVYCITGIGGPNAVKALKNAYPSQSNQCVSRFVRASIDLLEQRTGPDRYDNTKWFTAFMCSD